MIEKIRKAFDTPSPVNDIVDHNDMGYLIRIDREGKILDKLNFKLGRTEDLEDFDELAETIADLCMTFPKEMKEITDFI